MKFSNIVQLLNGVFEECQISSAKPSVKRSLSASAPLASVGASGLLLNLFPHHITTTDTCLEGFTECTPKSVENRLYMWKKKNVTAATASGDTPVSTPKKAAAKPEKGPSTLKAKTPRAKKGAAKKKVEEEADRELTPSAGRKRSFESEEAGEAKKIKLEQDIGEEDVDDDVKEEV